MNPTYAHVHLEPVGGVAGDMVLGALLGLGADEPRVRRVLESTRVSGVTLDVNEVEVCGERAKHVRSLDARRKSSHPGVRQPGLAAAHGHVLLADIEAWIARADASASVGELAVRIFRLLAAAEAEVHGGSAESVGLHEVGEPDSILDVLGIATAYELLGRPRLSCQALPSGVGRVHTSHGFLDCPVPAVRVLAERHRLPLVSVPVPFETVTPTGAAVVAALVSVWSDRPPSNVARVGVGAGTRRFVDRPNVLRAHGSVAAGDAP